MPGETGAGFTANRTLQNGWFEGVYQDINMFLCPALYRKLEVEFNIKHKSQENAITILNTKFIKI